METTKTILKSGESGRLFYRSQFWRLQKLRNVQISLPLSFIGHNFGDYKNPHTGCYLHRFVLSVTILETTKTDTLSKGIEEVFYRSQFWRLQKPGHTKIQLGSCFIGHNFGDYKNREKPFSMIKRVLSVTILETTKTTCPSILGR